MLHSVTSNGRTVQPETKSSQKHMKNLNFRLWALALVAFVSALFSATAQAATDITGVINDVEGYMDAAIVVGVAVLLFVLGRKVIRKLI